MIIVHPLFLTWSITEPVVLSFTIERGHPLIGTFQHLANHFLRFLEQCMFFYWLWAIDGERAYESSEWLQDGMEIELFFIPYGALLIDRV